MTYRPNPIDTSNVNLAVELGGLTALQLAELTERLAANTHEVWARQRMDDGWTPGPCRDDVRKQHPGLVPYAALTEDEKEYDRKTALETLKVIVALGYEILRRGDGPETCT